MALRRSLLWLLISLGAGCKQDPALETRAIGGGEGPAVTLEEAGRGSSKVLVYGPAGLVGGYRLTAHFQTLPGSVEEMDVTAEMTFRFMPGTPGVLEVFCDTLVLRGKVGANTVDTALPGDDPQVARMLETPLHRLRFELDGPVSATPNPDNPIAAQGANLIDSAVFLFPSLPRQAVGAGAVWKATRVIPKSAGAGPDISADVRYELVGQGACVHGDAPAECAEIAFGADTGERKVEAKGKSVTVRYTLKGTSVLVPAGPLLRSDATMTVALALPEGALQLEGTLTYLRL